jgi:hypothetical protein
MVVDFLSISYLLKDDLEQLQYKVLNCLSLKKHLKRIKRLTLALQTFTFEDSYYYFFKLQNVSGICNTQLKNVFG